MTQDYTGPERRTDQINRHEWDAHTRWVKEIDDKLDSHTQAEARMEERIDNIEKDIGEIKTNLKQVLDVLTAARGVWGFVGWAAGAVVSAGGLIALLWDKR